MIAILQDKHEELAKRFLDAFLAIIRQSCAATTAEFMAISSQLKNRPKGIEVWCSVVAYWLLFRLSRHEPPFSHGSHASEVSAFHVFAFRVLSSGIG
jgi:hypothetical protein